MPGSAPGERRGGRKKGTPNRFTALREKVVREKGASWVELRAARVADGADSIDFLTSIYRDPEVPLSVRIDCAKVVAPFDRPRLSAITSRDGQDVAQPIMAPDELREWARRQIAEAFGSSEFRTREPRTIEHQTSEES